MKASGLTPGVPDLAFVKAGRALFLEFKDEEQGRLSDAQIEVHAKLRNAGAEVATVHALDDALRRLENWQVIGGHTVLSGTEAPAPRRPHGGRYSTRITANCGRQLSAPGYGKTAPRAPGFGLDDMLPPLSAPTLTWSSSAAA